MPEVMMKHTAETICPSSYDPNKRVDNTTVMMVTPQVLQNARSRTDIEVPNYNSFSVDFKTGTSSDIDHSKLFEHPPKICDSALELFGRTPMVRLTRFAKAHGLKCDLDRIGKSMLEEAEESGRISRGSVIVEATSGNTGIGLCLAAAIKGYRVVITLPEKMSREKLNLMLALGAEIVRTPTAAPWNSLSSHIGLANQLQQTLPNCFFTDQYSNPANPRVHYKETAEEILYQCDHKVDMLVAGVGTGGTLTGVAHKMKEKIPTCKIVAVDPKGSILAQPDNLNDECRGQSYLVEGIGYDFIPPTLHRNLIDQWVKTDDAESFELARELIRLEGLFVGGSSGSALAGVLRAARHLQPSDRCVVILPDSCRNYMTKFLDKDWLVEHSFCRPDETIHKTPIWRDHHVSDLQLSPPVTLTKDSSIREAIETMAKTKISEIVVSSASQHPIGLLTGKTISSVLLTEKCTLEDHVDKGMTTNFQRAYVGTSLCDIAEMLQVHQCIVIVDNMDKISGVVTSTDLLKAIK